MEALKGGRSPATSVTGHFQTTTGSLVFLDQEDTGFSSQGEKDWTKIPSPATSVCSASIQEEIDKLVSCIKVREEDVCKANFVKNSYTGDQRFADAFAHAIFH